MGERAWDEAGGDVPGGAANAGEALRVLLADLRDLAPDDVGALRDVVQREVPWIDDVQLYLADYDHTVLRRLAPARRSPAPDELEVGAAGPGTVFRTEVPWWEPRGGGAVLWVPLTDRWRRLGVVRLEVLPGVGQGTAEEQAAEGVAIGAGLAQVLDTADAYTDALRVCRRRRGLALSAELQWELLPPTTLDLPEVSVAGVLEPAYEVGGDCFDHACNRGVLEVAVFDPVGHSLHASMIAALTMGAYRHARRDGLPLEQVGPAIDAAVAAEFGRSTFVTGRLGRLDLASGVLQWVNAGHPPPLWWHEGELVAWPEPRPDLPFGLGHTSTVHEVQLSPGDRVLLHTDGILEARPRAGEPFGPDGMVARFEEQARTGADLLAGLRTMVGALLDHLGGEALRDDATLLVVAWRGPAARP